MPTHICTLHSFHLKGFSLSSGHFATWLYGNRTFLSFSLSNGSEENAGKNISVVRQRQVTLLEVLIQLEEPVEHPENFFFVEKCTVLAKTSESTMGRCLRGSRLVHFHAHCQWVHLVCE